MSDHSAGTPADPHLAFASVARAIAGSLDIREVWDRVADCCHAIASFDAMGIVRLEADGRVYAVAAAGEERFKTLAGPTSAPVLATTAAGHDDFMVIVRDARQCRCF
jgi:hypothetical protein